MIIPSCLRIEPGDVIAVHRRWRGWLPEFGSYLSYAISAKIQRDTGSPINHVALALTPKLGVEAQMDGIQTVQLAKYFDDQKYGVAILRYTGAAFDERMAVARWAAEQEGEAYDLRLIVKIKLTLLMSGICGMELMIKLPDYDNVWICSELVQAAYRSQGIDLSPGLMFPGDFYRNPHFKTIYEQAIPGAAPQRG